MVCPKLNGTPFGWVYMGADMGMLVVGTDCECEGGCGWRLKGGDCWADLRKDAGPGVLAGLDSTLWAC